MLNINQTVEEGKAVIALEGRLDTLTASDLEKVVHEDLTDVTEVTLDMKDLEYIASAGLRVILEMYKLMLKRDGMKIRNVGPVVMSIFETTGFVDVMDIE